MTQFPFIAKSLILNIINLCATEVFLIHLGAAINIKINRQKKVWARLKFSTVAVGLSSSMYAVNSALKKSKQT